MSATAANIDEMPPDYWSHSRSPLSSFLFLIPLLLVYEIGVVMMGGENGEALRNGADYWMRGWLETAGVPFTFVLPFLVTTGLLVWHIYGKHTWRVSTETFVGMLAESLLFALCLVVLGQVQDLAFQRYLPASMSAPSISAVLGQSELLMIADSSTAGRIISFIGAGVYEEVLFRLCLLPICFLVFRVCFIPKRWAAFLAIFVTSLAFSVAHYLGPMADQFSLFSFSFRLIAGLFFSTLFMLRGFGITVGCHAAYDLLVGILFV